MRPIRVITPLWLWVLAACSDREGPPRLSDKPESRAGDVAQILVADSIVPDCQTGKSTGPDTGNVLSRNEIRTWARPDQPLRLPCESRSPSAVPATVGPDEAVAAEPPAAAEPGSPANLPDPKMAEPAGVSVPLVPGLTLLSVNRFPDGDRENVFQVTDVSPDGVTYAWQFIQRDKSGASFEANFERFVRATDLASAPRLNDLFIQRQPKAPGYTALTLSRATYARLRADGEAPYTVVWPQSGPFGGTFSGIFGTRVTLKGTLSLASAAPDPMPVLVNGRRVSLPALRLKGKFAFQDQKRETDFWVLADSLHPLLLKIVNRPETLQTVQIIVPQARVEEHAERQLETVCRVELPGVYFAFASAELQSASAPALAGVAALLQRHPDWSFSIEGHTDSIGDPTSNQTLSQRRAESVKAKLVEAYRIGPERLQAVGFGASRPREPNATIEGRARNRRVELVRAC